MIRRKLGEARTRYEQDVEAAIRRVPQWVGREVSYGMLVGGLLGPKAHHRPHMGGHHAAAGTYHTHR